MYRWLIRSIDEQICFHGGLFIRLFGVLWLFIRFLILWRPQRLLLGGAKWFWLLLGWGTKRLLLGLSLGGLLRSLIFSQLWLLVLGDLRWLIFRFRRIGGDDRVWVPGWSILKVVDLWTLLVLTLFLPFGHRVLLIGHNKNLLSWSSSWSLKIWLSRAFMAVFRIHVHLMWGHSWIGFCVTKG